MTDVILISQSCLFLFPVCAPYHQDDRRQHADDDYHRDHGFASRMVWMVILQPASTAFAASRSLLSFRFRIAAIAFRVRE